MSAPSTNSTALLAGMSACVAASRRLNALCGCVSDKLIRAVRYAARASLIGTHLLGAGAPTAHAQVRDSTTQADSLLQQAIAWQRSAWRLPGSVRDEQPLRLGALQAASMSGATIVRRAYLGGPGHSAYSGGMINGRFFRVAGFSGSEILPFANSLPPCPSGGEAERAGQLASLAVDTWFDNLVVGNNGSGSTEEWRRLYQRFLAVRTADSIMQSAIYSGAQRLGSGVLVPVLAFSVRQGEVTPFASAWLFGRECALLGWRSSKLASFSMW